MSKLAEIRPFVQQAAEAIASVVNAEITIVDDQLERIAGTHKFRNEIGVRLPKHFIIAKTIQTGKSFVIEQPGADPYCRGCYHYNDCEDSAFIAAPITLKDKHIGGIGLVAFGDKQKQHLIKRQKNLLNFIHKMSELLSSKVAEREEFNLTLLLSSRLEGVISSVQESILVIDKNSKLILQNFSAEQKTRIKGKKIKGYDIVDLFPNFPDEEILKVGSSFYDWETLLRRGDGTATNILANITPIRMQGDIEGAVITFKDIADIQTLIGKVSIGKILPTFDSIIGRSQSILAAKEKAKHVSRGNSTILLLGESGTGKELFAGAIHNASERSDGPFVVVNCISIPENLLESELFGYSAGAFTGASPKGRIGKFEQANGGTIFLDEIGDMPLPLQGKLLRVLQERTIERIGGKRPKQIDIRIISSTNKELLELVENGRFREDLYYRLAVIPIVIPPLREREGDISLLADHYRKIHNSILHKQIDAISPAAMNILSKYRWPGNVRELKNSIEHAVNLETEKEISLQSLPPFLIEYENTFLKTRIFDLHDQEQLLIKEAVDKFENSTYGKERAAGSLGISRATLYRKLKKYNL